MSLGTLVYLVAGDNKAPFADTKIIWPTQPQPLFLFVLIFCYVHNSMKIVVSIKLKKNIDCLLGI